MNVNPDAGSGRLVSLDVGALKPDAGKRKHHTAIDKQPAGGAIAVLASGPKGNGSGDPTTILHRPDHDVTAAMPFRALTLEPGLLPRLLAVGDDLTAELRAAAAAPAGPT